MEKKLFWNDAAKYGAILGLASIALGFMNAYMRSGWLSVLSFVVSVMLIYLFTRRRATLYGNTSQGYGYGRCLWFILCMSFFAGILLGVYTIVEARWIAPEVYASSIAQSMAIFESTGLYTPEQIESVIQMTRSPLFFIFSGVMSSLIQGLIFGLVIAAFVKRDANIFSEPNE